ncbi:hypothetical protein DND58_04885 [Pseudomonas syringae pv. pisi]|nr:hypothetical protein DND62_00795 [Pseudomonas syringae pv. pisi]PYD33001.1 hypothetical protein DND58_04885 [Pseudomonas syringae pv. pisi]PYD35533.1 hypothetical protein DND67_05660 [Pseudomonas syringae pv. pisi]
MPDDYRSSRSILTLQRGNAVLDALRPLLRASISAND